ncbi:UNVERIFIED_CONTAM: hypothetical protein MUK63_06585 [Blautia caecimuris]
MKEMDKIKTEIKDINDPAEMAGYLDEIRVAASLYCMDNCPDEVVIENGQLKDLTICGMINFLKSEEK